MHKLDIIKHSKLLLALPLVLIIIGIVVICVFGLNIGIDFAGGSTIYVEFNESFDVDDIRSIVSEYTNDFTVSYAGENGVDIRLGKSVDDIVLEDDVITPTPEETATSPAETEEPVVTQTPAATEEATESPDASQEASASAEATQEPSATEDAQTTADPSASPDATAAPTTEAPSGIDVTDSLTGASAVQMHIINDLKAQYGISDDQINIDYVGATVGKDLLTNAAFALIIAIVLMLIYIWIRFELYSGIAAVIALIHDVLIMFTFVAIFRTQINSPFVAAILTIVGYSINNTIIIFDRIRENNKKYGGQITSAENVNLSVSETMTRSINTTITTLIALVALYVLGVDSIKTFTLPIIVGIIAGFYSSVFITGPLWNLIKKDKKSQSKRVRL